MSNFVFGSKSLERRQGVRRELIEIDNLAIQLTIIDFGHPEYAGLRAASIQHGLFMDGKSKADGYEKLSKHQSGNALDFYAFVDGKASWEPEHLAIVACAYLQAAMILGYRIEWGGLWTGFSDMPHIQFMGRIQ